MKELYVGDVHQKIRHGESVELSGWVRAVRKSGRVTFIDLIDSTGMIQLVVEQDVSGALYKQIK